MFMSGAPWAGQEFFPDCGQYCFANNIEGRILKELSFEFFDNKASNTGRVEKIIVSFDDCIDNFVCEDGVKGCAEKCDDGG